MTIDAPLAVKILTAFIREELAKFGFTKGLLGLSGGLDSSVCAALTALALGPENVLGVMMPYGESFSADRNDAALIAASLGIRTERVDIRPMVDAYYEKHPCDDRLRRGNKMARERMSILYDLSARDHALILGTSNKTELLLGYGTLYGDMASALNPIGDLYKSHVWQLSEAMGVPREVVEKQPSADLWAGQTDEEELGFSYRQVDELLYRMVDLRMTRGELVTAGFEAGFIDTVYRKIQNSHFKRRLPVIAKVSNRTIDRDFRYSRDWGK